ncbi:MAG TPA: hypothetical protein VKY29_00050 [Cryomorphaceae bacterium]|nr:hypothetical protein [Cryomorphaceae bacterium]
MSALLVGSCFTSFAQSFPTVEAETISGKTVVVPGEFAGRYALIGVGAGKQAEEDLRTWQTPVYNKFIAKTGLMDQLFDVEVCFLPLFTGASQAVKGKVVKKLRENNESMVLEHVLVYSGDRGPFENIGVDDKNEPYFFLLDPRGEIVYRAVGKFRQKYFDEIEDILTGTEN